VILHVTILALVFAIGLVSVAAMLRRPRVIRSAFVGAGICWFVTELFVFPLTSYPIESMLEHRIPSFYFLGEYYYSAPLWKLFAAGGWVTPTVGRKRRSDLSHSPRPIVGAPAPEVSTHDLTRLCRTDIRPG
jgi:hypothetical protein